MKKMIGESYKTIPVGISIKLCNWPEYKIGVQCWTTIPNKTISRGSQHSAVNLQLSIKSIT